MGLFYYNYFNIDMSTKSHVKHILKLNVSLIHPTIKIKNNYYTTLFINTNKFFFINIFLAQKGLSLRMEIVYQ